MLTKLSKFSPASKPFYLNKSYAHVKIGTVTPQYSKEIHDEACRIAARGPYIRCERITREINFVKKSTNNEQFAVFDEISLAAFHATGHWRVTREHLDTKFNPKIISELIEIRLLKHDEELGWYTNESLHRAKFVRKKIYDKFVKHLVDKSTEEKKKSLKLRQAAASRRVRVKKKSKIDLIEKKVGVRVYANTPLFVLDYIEKNATLRGIGLAGAKIVPSRAEITRQSQHTRRMNSLPYFEWSNAFKSIESEEDVLITRDYRYSMHVKKLIDANIRQDQLPRVLEICRDIRKKQNSTAKINIGLICKIFLTEDFSRPSKSDESNKPLHASHIQVVLDKQYEEKEDAETRRARARKYLGELGNIGFRVSRSPPS